MNRQSRANRSHGMRSRRPQMGPMPRNQHRPPNRNRQSKLPSVIKDTYPCNMKYTSQLVGLSSSLSDFMTQGWVLNSIFRPELTGTDTSSAIGFFEMVALFNTWHVRSARIEFTVVNEENFEVVASIAPSTIPLAISTNAQSLQLGEMPWGKTWTLSRNTGQNRHTFDIKVNLSKLNGNRAHYFADNQFFGATGARPSTLRYLYTSFGALAPNVFVNGVTFSMRITYKVFFCTRIFNDITGFAGKQLIRRRIDHCEAKISIITTNALSKLEEELQSLQEELRKLEIRKSELLIALRDSIT